MLLRPSVGVDPIAIELRASRDNFGFGSFSVDVTLAEGGAVTVAVIGGRGSRLGCGFASAALTSRALAIFSSRIVVGTVRVALGSPTAATVTFV